MRRRPAEARIPPSAALLRVVPTALLLALALALAWRERGSIVAADWLLYAILAGFLLATVVLFGEGFPRPSRLALAAVTGLSGLAAWTALSLTWSPVPSLARDEALLITLYAVALITPALTLRSDGERVVALAAVVLGLGAAAIATGAVLAFGESPQEHFRGGRLYFPITYVNAEAALALVGVWPALALAARRDGSPAWRATGLAAAVACLGVWFLTQSAGGGVALVASAVIVLAVARERLRLLVPAALAGGLAALAARPLTEPYRADGLDLENALRDAGKALLLVTVAAAVVGVAYALADRRVSLSHRTRHLVGRAALVAVLVGALSGAAAFVAVTGDPSGFVQERWDALGKDPELESESSHFASYGSERPDIWRVALTAFREHPAAGVGARGFGTVYSELGRTEKHPERAHSLPLDVLAETGLVGIALLALGIMPLLAIAIRSRATPWGVAALGGGSYWLAHAAGDWLWTVPSLGLSFFLLLGIAASNDDGDRRELGRRTTIAAGAAVAAVALLAFAPPWLSARFTEHALRSGDPGGLRLARRLDPLSISPYLAQSALAESPAEAIPPLRRALEREPRSAPLHLLLSNQYRAAGRTADARAELLIARRLDPHSEWARTQLELLDG